MFNPRYFFRRLGWIDVTGIIALALSLAATSSGQTTDRARSAEEQPENESGDDAPPDTTWRRPLWSRNQFPVSLMFVALAPDKAGALPAGRNAFDLHFSYSNIISGQESDDELAYFDLEYLRTTAMYRRGFPERIELGVSIPFYIYYGGFLDGFVGGFHRSLGLPNFLRGQTENGLVRYDYRNGDEVAFEGDEAFSAVGDVTLHFKKTLVERDRNALAVRTDVKLPVGDPEHLSGSGAADVGIGGAFDHITDRWAVYVNANYHFLGQPDGFTVTDYFSAMVGADYRLKPRLTAHLQLDHARPFVVSELPLFREGATQVALGLRWHYSERFVYEWRFVEDLSDISPDFTFAFQLGLRWDPSEEVAP